jgi:hypothetical protein
MKDQLDQQLVEKYPEIFRDRHAPMTHTAMCWGFECGDGWYQILDSLCGQIQSHIDWQNENFAKGYPQYKEVPQVVATQVKEKFGGLRFYYNGGDDVIDGMVRMAESWAAYTCEECGAPGQTRGGGWIRTLCDDHDQKRKKTNE